MLGRLAPGRIAKLNVAVDLLALVGALSGSVLLFGAPPPEDGSGLMLDHLVGALVLWVIGSSALNLYEPFAQRTGIDDAAQISLLILVEVLLLGAATPAVDVAGFAWCFLLIAWPVILGTRLLVFRPLCLREGPLDEVLIVGAGAMGACTGEDLQRQHPRRRIMGYLVLGGEARSPAIPAGEILGPVSHLERVLSEHVVNEVYLAGSALRHGAEMQEAVKLCERLGVPFALPACSFRLDRARLVGPGRPRDGYLHYAPLELKPHQMALKRLFDIVASAMALLLLSPLLLGVAGAIKATSRGPVFFRQRRVGLHGRTFWMFKFRSMVVDAERLRTQLESRNEQSGPVFKIRDDPRITPVGRFIRKYSIDELPQLLNVLRGDMSIVGPRPPLPSEVAKYEGWQRRRLSVRPGLTCIWQVSGRNQISFKEWMYLDMQYIDHWSLLRDFQLIFRTVPVVFTGRGAS